MIGYKFYEARWWIVTALFTLAIIFGIAAIWIESGKLGGTAAILSGVGLIGIAPAAIWSDDPPHKPEPRWSRESRRELKKAEEKILLDREIKRLEWELRS